MSVPVGEISALNAESSKTSLVDVTLGGMDATDTDLMCRYVAGELRAFEELYRRHKAPLFRYLKRMCHDADIANDLFQEVWGKLIASRKQYEVRASFKTYLYRIAHNACIDFYRRAGTRAIVTHDDEAVQEAPEPHGRPEDLAADVQTQDALLAALKELPPEQRTVFLLYEESGLSLEDIGRMTQVGTETAKSRLRYALRKLRRALQPYRTPEAVK